ncbi:MAG TPA: VWA-like domain-containing protein [Trebonia sp.]
MAAAAPLDHTRLAAARLRAAEAQPFLAVALYALTALADDSRPTFAVDERWRLYVNPQALAEWSVAEVAGVLLHEVGHVVRDHAGRARSLAVAGERAARLWNIAADAEINDDLMEADVTLPHDAVTPERLGMPTGKVAEFYYSRIWDQLAADPEDWQAADCGPGSHGQGTVSPGASAALPDLPPGLSNAEAVLLRRRVAEEINRLSAVGSPPGSGAGGWIRWAEAALRPRLPWRRLLVTKVRSSAAAVSGAADYSYDRPARRRVPGVVLPSMRRPLPRVAVIIDTSASVTDEMLELAWTEVHGCLRHLGIRRDLLTVYAADTQTRRLPGAPRRKVALEGGGGTDMAAALEVAAATRPAPDLIIVITDGFTPWPSVPPARQVIVALMPGPAPSPDLAPPRVPSWGQVVEIEPAEKH